MLVSGLPLLDSGLICLFNCSLILVLFHFCKLRLWPIWVYVWFLGGFLCWFMGLPVLDTSLIWLWHRLWDWFCFAVSICNTGFEFLGGFQCWFLGWPLLDSGVICLLNCYLICHCLVYCIKGNRIVAGKSNPTMVEEEERCFFLWRTRLVESGRFAELEKWQPVYDDWLSLIASETNDSSNSLCLVVLLTFNTHIYRYIHMFVAMMIFWAQKFRHGQRYPVAWWDDSVALSVLCSHW